VYFDNVGGAHREAAIGALNLHGRVVLCGMISQYNDTRSPVAPRNLVLAINKRLRMEGMLASDHLDLRDQFIRDAGNWIREGEVTSMLGLLGFGWCKPTCHHDLWTVTLLEQGFLVWAGSEDRDVYLPEGLPGSQDVNTVLRQILISMQTSLDRRQLSLGHGCGHDTQGARVHRSQGLAVEAEVTGKGDVEDSLVLAEPHCTEIRLRLRVRNRGVPLHRGVGTTAGVWTCGDVSAW
jgi:hypothetical protein